MAVGKKITDLTESGSLKDTDLAIVHDGNGTKKSTLTQLSEYMGTKFSNPNLLINPDFKITHRGKTSYQVNGFEYTVDRWRIQECTVLVSDNGLTIQNVGSEGSWISQKFEKKLDGVYTLSIKVSSISGRVYLTSPDNNVNITSAGIYSVTLSNLSEFNMFVETGSSVTFEWAKLEQGSIATPFVAPNPAEELTKCYRFKYIGGANLRARCTGNQVFGFTKDLPTTLRTAPTMTFKREYTYNVNSLNLSVKDGNNTVYISGTAENTNQAVIDVILDLDAEIY